MMRAARHPARTRSNRAWGRIFHHPQAVSQKLILTQDSSIRSWLQTEMFTVLFAIPRTAACLA